MDVDRLRPSDLATIRIPSRGLPADLRVSRGRRDATETIDATAADSATIITIAITLLARETTTA